MKSIMVILGVLVAFSLTGCDEETTRYVEIDNSPAVPQGVYSVTGDGKVTIYWLPVQDEDLDHYEIYWNDSALGQFTYMASTTETFYEDTDVDNGVTYYYAVLAVDEAGNESELSYENVYDTPRDDGQSLFLQSMESNPNLAGYDFSEQEVVPFDDADCDIFVDYDEILEAYFINAANLTTDLQDMGFTYSFDEINYAPDSGWSNVGWSEIIYGHTYVIWTSDNHYAKVRVTLITTGGVVFDWAWQNAQGNPELAKPEHGDDYLKREKRMTIIK